MATLRLGINSSALSRRVRDNLTRFGPTTPKPFGAKHQTCPHSAAHAPWLIEMVVGHPSLPGLRRFVFVTRDDHGFTSAAGFARRPARGDMEWHRPDTDARATQQAEPLHGLEDL